VAWFNAHDRTEFIKIWYEFARVLVVFRSVLPESYERPRPPDVSGITFRAIFLVGKRSVGLLALAGSRRYISGNFPSIGA